MPTLPQAEPDDPVLTTAAAARLLGVAVSTAQLWLEGGALPSWKTPGGHRRVKLSAVTRLLDTRRGAVTRQGNVLAGPSATAPLEFQTPSTHDYPLPQDETARLAAVRASGLLDTPPEHVFDRLTWLATQVTECPIAMLTLLTSERAWFKSRVGLEASETPRAWAFCSHAILHDGEAMMIEDTSADARFAANPLVTGAPHVRFYGGVPVRDADGHALGTLCVLDREPRRLRERELKALEELATIAAEEVRRRAKA
jgi:excisionase family DNA binding protein